MPTPDRTLNALRRMPARLRLVSLSAAVRHATDGEMPCFAQELLALAEESRGPGVAALIPLLLVERGLDRTIRIALLDCLGPNLPALLDRLLSSGNPEHRLAGFRLAADASLEKSDPESPVGWIFESPAAAAALDSALALAAEDYPSHRIGSVLVAVWRSAEASGPGVRRFLHEPSHASHLHLRASARAHADAQPVRRLVAWLGLPPLAAVARGALEHRASEDRASERSSFLESLFVCAHLLPLGSRASEARRLAKPERFLPDPEHISGYSEAARRGVLGWLSVLPIKRERALALFAAFAEDASPIVRLDAVRRLSRLEPTLAGDELLRRFAVDSHPAVAGTAASSLTSAGSPSRRKALAGFLASLAESPHDAVRRIAALSRRAERIGGAGPTRVVVRPSIPRGARA